MNTLECPESGLSGPWADRGARNGSRCFRPAQRGTGRIRAISGRVRSGPGGAGNTNRSLTHPDRLRRSKEGCHGGYPSHAHPSHWIHPVSGKNPQRRACPKDHARELLAQQGYVCVYCAEPFGSVVKRRKLSVTMVNYDHAIPLAFLNSNPRWNWVAACNVCNAIKGSKMFASIHEIRMHVLEYRDTHRHQTVWVPPVSCEENPQRWAEAFATFLTTLDYRSRKDLKVPSPLGQALSTVELTIVTDDLDAVDTSPRFNEKHRVFDYPRLTAGRPWPWSRKVS